MSASVVIDVWAVGTHLPYTRLTSCSHINPITHTSNFTETEYCRMVRKLVLCRMHFDPSYDNWKEHNPLQYVCDIKPLRISKMAHTQRQDICGILWPWNVFVNIDFWPWYGFFSTIAIHDSQVPAAKLHYSYVTRKKNAAKYGCWLFHGRSPRKILNFCIQ